MTCLPQISVRRWPMVRAMRSVDAPGVNGTTQRMGFEGKLSADSDLSAAMHALAQHNDNASNVVFIGLLRELNIGVVVTIAWPGATSRLKLPASSPSLQRGPRRRKF